jgi:DNA (cytosine-5)-methyltransferase 1
MRTIAFSEIEAFAAENLVAKMEAGWLDAAPIWTNLKTFPWERFRDKVDILSGGFPCQPFSSAGRRAGDDDPRHLWPHIVKGIKRLGRPSLVFFENVEGIISSKLKSDGWADPVGTPVLLHVLRELERVGYQATAGVFSAREIGAPHQRKRVFIMGVRSDLSDTGRALVSEMLSATERGDVGDAKSVTPPCRRYKSYKSKKRSRHSARHTSSSCITAYPTPRGAEQYEWEPPRATMGNAKHREHGTHSSKLRLLQEKSRKRLADRPTRPTNARRTEPRDNIKTQPPMGRDADGAPRWMDYAELCHAVDNRTDELRLLGNGVVPATAERAFRVMWRELSAGNENTKG